MDVIAATAGYEAWLAKFCTLNAADVAHKHAQMADANDPFPFFRGTYYRWTTLWPAACPDLATAPRVLGVGDLHVENFGTWRDADGRLCWGINDFDEVDHLPYTDDLVRLAASARLARKGGALDAKTADACGAILEGYRSTLTTVGGTPFVLEERHPELRVVATAAERDPARYWAKLTKLLDDPAADPSVNARAALERDLPSEGLKPAYRFRPRAGMGSLGRPRYVALAEWSGGWVCREAKAIAPPATAWASGATDNGSHLTEAVGRAVRAPDPFYRADGGWVVRRLAPHCSRIGLDGLKKVDVRRMLNAMGSETANVHLGTPGAAAAILDDLARRPAGWLEVAARTMCDVVERDWAAWRAGQHGKN